MGLLDRFRRNTDEEERGAAIYPYDLNTWASDFFTYNGNAYNIQQSWSQGGSQEIGQGFEGVVRGAYKSNGVIFACSMARARIFSQMRFQFRRVKNGVPGDLFGTGELSILEHPWNGATTADILNRAIQDVDLAGNFFAVRRNSTLRRLRPDWVTIVIGSNTDATMDSWDIEADVIGYMYHPGGRQSGRDPIPLLREEVAHFAPTPDPVATFRGMSWLTPIIREIQADSAMVTHKQSFMDKGATPNMLIKFDAEVKKDAFDLWVKKFKEGHEGVANAYKTLFLAGGADATVIGANMRQLDFKAVQGHGETRIAAAAGVPPIIVGLSEGLDAATYSNYGQARRAFADTTCADLWQNMAGSMANVIKVPGGSELWYDTRHIPFLAEDQKDAADIQNTRSLTIRELVNAGFTAESVVKAVLADDMSILKHTGLFSVQLQAPGSTKMPQGEAPGEIPVGPGTAPETPKVTVPATPAAPKPTNGTKPAVP